MYHVLKKGDIVFNENSDKAAEDAIKNGAVELTPQEIAAAGMAGYEHLVSPENTVVEDDGTIVFKPPRPELLETVKARKLAEINSSYQQAISTLTPTYPDDERLTFDKQEAEARGWLADNSFPTPFVDALAAGRQMDKAELVKRIIAKADAFALASGSLTGQRQRYEDLLDVAETPEAVAAIVPQYSLPGMEAQA